MWIVGMGLEGILIGSMSGGILGFITFCCLRGIILGILVVRAWFWWGALFSNFYSYNFFEFLYW